MRSLAGHVHRGRIADLRRLRRQWQRIVIAKYREDQARDERGRWTSGGGSSSETTSIAGKSVTVELSPASRAAGETIHYVNAAAVDRAWSRDRDFYVGPGGRAGDSGEVSGRYDRFAEYLATHDRMQAAEFGVQRDGRVGFTNGRHRFAVMRDIGMSRIPVAMDRESIANARRHGYL